jgi:Icc protein
MNHTMSRRGFLQRAAAVGVGGLLPLSLVKLAFADESQSFTFVYISDSHIQQIKGAQFVRNWDQGLKRAVAEANLLSPKPDFVLYGGDIAQLGKKEEIDHGLELLSPLTCKVHYAMGEHDYYLDLGEYWESRLGPQYYSFDHKGVHFVVLNSVLTYDDWIGKWPTPMERMVTMAGLDNPNGSPFMVGDAQREWLRQDLARVLKTTPVVVLSHSPLQKIFKGWNFWTEDAEQVQSLLAPFDKVSVIYGHVHQIQYNQIGSIAFNSAMATAWPWPYPQSYVQAPSHLPVLTVPMNRADPFFERDATGWQLVDIYSGRPTFSYVLYDNNSRVVAFNESTRRPQDRGYQLAEARIPPQIHY